MTAKKYYPIFVYCLIPISGMSTDIYLPSLPSMAHYFQVDRSLAQLSITVFMLAMGIAQLIAGPISDAIGRKKLILVALATQMLCVGIIIFSTTIKLLLICRFFQGAAAAFTVVPTRAILSDIFQGEQLHKHLNNMVISFALGPIIAPFIGGYLQHYFGWQANFYFLMIYACLFFFFTVSCLQETLADKKRFSTVYLWHNYKEILTHTDFLKYMLLACSIFGYSTLFSVMGPFIFQKNLHLSAIAYGYIALGAGVAWFSGNTLNRVFIDLSSARKIRLAINISSIFIAILLLFAIVDLFTVYSMTLPIYGLIFCSAVIFPIMVIKSLSLFAHLAASANACFFSSAWVAAGIYTAIATFLNTHSVWPIALTFLGINLAGHLIISWGEMAQNRKN